MTDRTRIPWTCVTCGFPIADGTGSVNIPFAELSAHRPGRELVWRVQHDACLATDAVYGVDVDYLPLIMQRINRRRDPVAYIKAAGDDLGLFDFGEVTA